MDGIKSLADLNRHVQPGTRFRCVENTYRPELNGTTRTVTRVQTNGFYWRIDGGTDPRESWTMYPKAALFQFDGSHRFAFALETRNNDIVRLELLPQVPPGFAMHCEHCGHTDDELNFRTTDTAGERFCPRCDSGNCVTP